jgi:hypothetical protein
MERGSDRHGPQIDEELKRETRSIERGAPIPSRVEDFREIEPVEWAERQERPGRPRDVRRAEAGGSGASRSKVKRVERDPESALADTSAAEPNE